MKRILPFIFIVVAGFASSQINPVDSLKRLLKPAKQDSIDADLLNNIARFYQNAGDQDNAMAYAVKAQALSRQLHYAKGEARARITVGTAFLKAGDYPKALDYFYQVMKAKISDEKCLGIAYYNTGMINYDQGDYDQAAMSFSKAYTFFEKIKDKNLQMNSQFYLGNIFLDKGDYPNAMKNYLLALRIAEEAGDKIGMGDIYGSLGNIYALQYKFAEALDYYFKALKIREAINDRFGLSSSHNNIGYVYQGQGKYEEALKEHRLALAIAMEIKELKQAADAYTNIGTDLSGLHDYPGAFKNFRQALDILEKLGDKGGIGTAYINIGEADVRLKKAAEARGYLDKALQLAGGIGNKEVIKDCYKAFVELDSLEKDHKNEFEHYKLFIAYRDSLTNEDNTKKMVRLEMNYDFNKKEAATKLEQEKKEAVARSESKKQRIIIWSVCGILVLVIGFAVFAYRSYLQKQKANVEILHQKHIIEEKQKEILDSIHYAKRIQTALMTSEKYIDRNLARMTKQQSR